MKKKVLYVITKSNFGGAQRYVFDLATHLPKEVFEPVVALGGTGMRDDAPGALKEKLEHAGIRTIPVHHFMRDMSPLDDIKAFFELVYTIRKEKPDILHVTSSKAGGIGAFSGRILRVPQIIFTSHGLAFDESWRPRWQRILIMVASWCTFLFAHHTIQITNATLERAKRMPFMGGGKQVRIYNGITAPHLLSRKDAREALVPGGHLGDEPVIGTLAELTKNKNLSILIDALSLLHKKGVRAHCIVCGDGEEHASLTQQIKERGLEKFVHLLGYVPEASRLLKAFDVFALPSKKEGLPYVLIEAGHASLPVVASAIPGIEDVILNEKTGRTVRTTAEDFSEALLKLLQDAHLSERYGNALHEHVRSAFSIERMVTETVQLYSASKPTISLSNFSR